MNSAAVNDPELVREAAKKFGSGRITIAIDARRNEAMPSGFELVVSGGTKPVGKDAIAWAAKCEELGAGGSCCRRAWTGTGPGRATTCEFTKAIARP